MTAAAFDALGRFALTGTDYTTAMTYRYFYGDPAELELVIAKGHEIVLPVEVPDQGTEGTVTGTSKVRVLLRTTDGALLLRARVEWQTSQGHQHAAQAAYAIASREMAQKVTETMADVMASPLPDDNPTPQDRERIRRAAGADIAITIEVNGSWEHEYPGVLNNEDDFEAYARLNEAARSVIDARVEYHERAVDALITAHPEMLCMLTPTDMGSVHPDELEKLLSWLSRQPVYTV